MQIMKYNSIPERLTASAKYFFFQKKFSGPRASVLGLLLIPLVAFPLAISDYENTATVNSSDDQFESNTTNNSSTVQVTPNAEIVIVKEVINDDGGTLSLVDFNIATDAGSLVFDSGSVTGSTTTFTSEKIFVAAGTYSLTEISVPGYTAGLWSCDAGVLSKNMFDDGELTLAFGESAICTIVNDDVAPSLTLTKTMVNDDGGLLTDADFDLSIDSTVVASGVAQTVASNAAITISELDLPGYTEGTWSCTDANSLTTGLPTAGVATGSSVTLSPGADVTCAISNDDIAPLLTLVKNLTNDDGGLLTVADFDLSIDGTVVPDSAAQTVAANTALSISELAVPGYTAGTWECTDAAGLTTGLPTAGVATGEPVTLLPGSNVTCAIANDDIAPTLTLSKTLTNDNGGALTIDDFDISIDGTEVGNNAPQTVAANAAITVSELDIDGYTEGTWSCVDANGLATGLPTAGAATGTSVTLAPGSEVTCSIVNDDVAPSLTLAKSVVNDDGGIHTVTDFDISIDGNVVANGAPNLLSAGVTYTISEIDHGGYVEGTWSCGDANGLTTGLPTAGVATGTTLVLAEGADVTCKIVNDDIAPILTLTKTVTNDDGGALTVADFDISLDGTEVTNSVASTVTANTDIVISELDIDGYTEGTWACSDANSQTTGLPTSGVATATTVNLASGSAVTCAIVNDDVPPTLTLVKNITNDNGGDLTAADFGLAIDGTSVPDNVAQTVAANTAITISELDLPGYTEGTWSCVDANALTSGLPTAGAAIGESLTILPGSAVTCEISNDDIAPTLSLVKVVVNDNGGDLASTDFDISIDGTVVPSGQVNPVAANAAITISEIDVAGYAEGTWSCVDANSLTTGLPAAGTATGASLTLEPGSSVECTIANDDEPASLTLVKTLNNNAGGALTIADFDIAIDGAEVNSGTAVNVVANTSITVSELDLPGYTEGTWSCVDANGLTTGLPTAGLATGVSFEVATGADVTCSITNADVAPTLTLTKTLINDDGGDLTIADFDISIDGSEVTSGVANNVAANTDIEISELDIPGYTVGTWSCRDDNNLTTGLPAAGTATGTTLNLLEGSAVVCEIVNDDIAPTLTLAKTITNDDGGALTVADFDISIDGTEVPVGVAQTVAANSAITISELALPGYTEGNWSCADANSLTTTLPIAGVATGETLTLEPGSDVTCSIVNDDIGPQLTLVKSVINDDGGLLTVADFNLAIAGAVVASATPQTVLANTPINIAEPDLPGYAEGTWACTDANNLTSGLLTGGIATGDVVTLAPGADVTCLISNNDIAPQLTLTKTLINDNGGDLVVDDFDISIDGTEVPNGVAQTVQANTAITISELEPDGYLPGIWSCTDATGLSTGLPAAGAAAGESITLASGADVTCEITNNDIPPTLTLVKNVVNDNGGDKTIDDFDISIDGTEVASGTAVPVDANTLISIAELDLVQYAEGVWTCTDANGLATGLPTAGVATGATLTLAPGSEVTCEITNDDLGIDLTIAKVVSDTTPNIGDTITFTLTVSNNGPDIATNATVTDVILPGFSYVVGSISGGTSNDESDPTGTGLGWTLASVPVGSPITLTFDVTVNAP